MTGANAQQQAVYNSNIAKVKATLRSLTARLDVLQVANRHGWDIAKRLIERRQTGEDKELQLAIDDIRKREAEKGKQDWRDRDRRRSRLRYGSPSPKKRWSRSRSRSRSRSPRRYSSSRRPYRECSPLRRDNSGRSRDRERGRCFFCRGALFRGKGGPLVSE